MRPLVCRAWSIHLCCVTLGLGVNFCQIQSFRDLRAVDTNRSGFAPRTNRPENIRKTFREPRMSGSCARTQSDPEV